MLGAIRTSKACEDWPELSVVQRWFQAVVTHPNGVDAGAASNEAHALIPLSRRDLEQIVTRSESVSARDRLSIYANAYYARLFECLGDTFPILKRTLGAETFNAFAFGFLQTYPSRSYTLGKLGERFPDYLEETRPAQDEDAGEWPDFLIDLAKLEWAIAEVFDGPGIENVKTLTTDQLRDIQPHEWPSVRLQTAPCLRLLHTRYPLNDYYTAIRQASGDDAAPIPGPAESYIAVTRRHYVVRRHDLIQEQYVLLEALQSERTIEEAITLAASASELDDRTLSQNLHDWFRDWTQAQFFENLSRTDST